MNSYRGKHASTRPWAVATTASSSHYRGRHQQKNRRRRRWLIIIAVLLLILGIYPFGEAHLLTVEHVSLSSGDLPADINHLKIVYLSDIHAGFGLTDWDLQRLVTQINQLKPDLVLFGGDYATDNLSAVRFFQQLPSIHARYGILGVVGETDRGTMPTELNHLTDTMRDAGVTPLVNAVSRVRIGSSTICVAGLDDPLTGSTDIPSVARQVSATDFVILLCHSPTVIPASQLATDSMDRLGWYDLGLFGHTHGGQMMFFSSLLEIAPEVPDRYRAGWLTENRTHLLISRGVGTSVIPARLLCFPQIHEIDVSLN